MAIWQYTLVLIPNDNFAKKLSVFHSQENTIYRKDTVLFWKDTTIELNSLTTKIDNYFICEKIVGQNSIYWKDRTNDHEDNDCSIYFSDSQIEELTIRIDLRKIENTKHFTDLIIEISSKYNLIAMNLKSELFEPTQKLIYNDILNSNAIKFLSNPHDFVENLS